MSDLSIMRARVALLVQDVASLIFSSDELDIAIRQALAQYSYYLPYERRTVVTLGVDGNEADLSQLSEVHKVTRVWYPWHASLSLNDQEENLVSGWDLIRDSGSLALAFYTPVKPKAGEQVRVHYTTTHTLEGLDAAVVTTIPLYHYTLLAQGAAAYALLSGATDRADTENKDRLLKAAEKLLHIFEANLRLNVEMAQSPHPFQMWQKHDKYGRIY